MPGPRPPAAVWGEGECTPPRPGPRELNPPAAPHLPVLSGRVASPTPPTPRPGRLGKSGGGVSRVPLLSREPLRSLQSPPKSWRAPHPPELPFPVRPRGRAPPRPAGTTPLPWDPVPRAPPGLSEAERSEGGLSEPRPSPHSRGRLGGSCPAGGRVALCAGSLPRPPPRGAPGPVLRPGVPSPGDQLGGGLVSGAAEMGSGETGGDFPFQTRQPRVLLPRTSRGSPAAAIKMRFKVPPGPVGINSHPTRVGYSTKNNYVRWGRSWECQAVSQPGSPLGRARG